MCRKMARLSTKLRLSYSPSSRQLLRCQILCSTWRRYPPRPEAKSVQPCASIVGARDLRHAAKRPNANPRPKIVIINDTP